MDKILSDIKSRVIKYLEISGISREEFYRTSGIAASNFKGEGRKSELGGEKIAKILTLYPNLNATWLLTGEGEIIKIPHPEREGASEPKKSAATVYSTLTESVECNVADVAGEYDSADRRSGMQAVPLYEFDASTQLSDLLSGVGEQRPVGHISLPDLPSCDGAVYVHGDSMSPILKSGDVVLYKAISDIRNGILWGEMYLLSFEIDGEQYVAVKYIQRSDDAGYVRLVSHNAHHSPKDIPLESIRALAIVKASVRYNTMG